MLETNNSALESKYHGKLNADTMLVIGMLILLVVVEVFVLYEVLTRTWEIASDFFYLYVVFLGLLIVIETIGCWSVRKSIKKHMFEFEYYD